MIEYTQQMLLENSELKKALERIGLVLSEAEINDLNRGKTILLENMELSQIGLVLIIASALLANNQGQDKTAITFKDLPKKAHNCSSCLGIPLYSCKCELNDEFRCVYLTFINGIPALKICCRIKAVLKY